jgi:hypothetical protein
MAFILFNPSPFAILNLGVEARSINVHRRANKGERIAPDYRMIGPGKECMKILTNKSLATSICVGMVVAAMAAATIAQEGAKGGGKKLIELSQIKTQAEAEALKPGDTVAMICAKCKSVQITYATKESKDYVTILRPGEKHLCPGCKSTIEVVGHGKAKTDEVKHVCKSCGDDSAYCCATKPGTRPTLGMVEKEKK